MCDKRVENIAGNTTGNNHHSRRAVFGSKDGFCFRRLLPILLLERWKDQAALDDHAKVNATRAPLDPTLRSGASEREDYEYNRTR